MNHTLAASTPPLGWNSWDCYGAAVTEDEIRGNAEYMAEHLKDFGWSYITVDIQWYEPLANSSQYRPFVPLIMDEYSRLMPAENRFPSAASGQGFKPLADYVHSLGLQFGIHIMRGIPRQAAHAATPILGTTATARDIAHPNSICPWNTDMYGVDSSKEGAQAYYDSLFELYAQWGVDLVKVDDIAASRLYDTHQPEIEMISKAIERSGRPMVLSLSPGPAPVEYSEFLAEHANMWRVTDDFWDLWPLLLDMFDRCRTWQGVPKAGCWPDCDMLPLGHIGIRSVDGGGADRWTRFTPDEQLTMMSLWSIFRSPLIFGGELRDNDDWTLSLLTNREVLRMHRESYGAREALRREDLIVWTAQHAEGSSYVAVFNIGENALPVDLSIDEIGLSDITEGVELWSQEAAEFRENSLAATVPAHGARLYRFS
ncbi:glycoside hydrolase family 27 protein [Paenibacillus sp. SZ31]|uniref:glycoside hydrolase family 27 protein n=1 Tax=Paenibacillus sp. SZ31 TaxID=2725555 RepID=UPI00146B59F8|nr:glycoside hydrolase family 27 protein [Paenibacillus sp. SZ31]NMI03585.1 glycoside hydrolase family 27 protein [Paenibacillus sp. SZ31]